LPIRGAFTQFGWTFGATEGFAARFGTGPAYPGASADIQSERAVARSLRDRAPLNFIELQVLHMSSPGGRDTPGPTHETEWGAVVGSI
jgi:hypothetical protein